MPVFPAIIDIVKSEHNDTGGAFLHAAGSLKTDHVLNMARFLRTSAATPGTKNEKQTKGGAADAWRESETRNVTKPGGYPIEVKRRTIRDSIQVHRRLGTKYAVEKALGAVYPGTKVEEWFEYGGDPYKFRVVIGATEAGITADRQAAVLDRVRFYKNLRSHLEAISYQIEKRTAVKVAAVHAIGQRVEVYPYLARNMESHGGFYCGGYTQYGRKLAVFPNK